MLTKLFSIERFILITTALCAVVAVEVLYSAINILFEREIKKYFTVNKINGPLKSNFYFQSNSDRFMVLRISCIIVNN